jgi:hypothetical protein
LYFDNNAAAGYDNFDSDKMMVPNTAQVYTLVGNKKLAINGMKSVKANKQDARHDAGVFVDQNLITDGKRA